MGTISRPETSVRNCRYSLRNNPEERSSHLLHDEASNLSLGLCVLSLVYETIGTKSLFLIALKNVSPLAMIPYVTEQKTEGNLHFNCYPRRGKK